MRKMTVPLAFAATVALMTMAVMSLTSNSVSLFAQTRPVSSYAEDRAAIKDVIARMPNPATTAGLRPAAARHNISNIVIKVDGNKAAKRSYWFHYSNDNPQRKGIFDGFGHYEDELAKVDGKWLFTKRKIYNEGRDEWAYKGGKNPAW
jgi:3-phenylpropionate/cinnamic acid dioxygenase small subunit